MNREKAHEILDVVMTLREDFDNHTDDKDNAGYLFSLASSIDSNIIELIKEVGVNPETLVKQEFNPDDCVIDLINLDADVISSFLNSLGYAIDEKYPHYSAGYTSKFLGKAADELKITKGD